VGQPLPPVPRQPVVHTPSEPSHTRPLWGPPQSLSVLQPQMPVVRQTGRLAEHCEVLVGEHWLQTPFDRQAGSAPLQSVSLWQVPRQVPVATLQIEVSPVHWAWLVAEHWLQEPSGWQAGVVPPHSASRVQPRQTPMSLSHTGVAPVHCEVSPM
jgi:hypothetical protein